MTVLLAPIISLSFTIQYLPVFKAKLIDNTNYYKLKHKQVILGFAPLLLVFTFFDRFFDSVWLAVLFLCLYLGGIVAMFMNQKKIAAALSKRSIQITETEVVIKSKKEADNEVINVMDLNGIIVKEDYTMPEGSLQDMIDEFAGNQKKNYLILEQDGQRREFHFDVDSHYMIAQLNKIISHWVDAGYPVEIAGRAERVLIS